MSASLSIDWSGQEHKAPVLSTSTTLPWETTTHAPMIRVR